MSLSTNISNLATAIGTDVKSLTTKIGDLTKLTTSSKSSIVDAINELRGAQASASGIDDNSTASTSTWSSSKIQSVVSAVQPAWSAITGKPTTFAPTIGTTADTAKAGDWVPAWSDVTSKPTLAAVATSGSYADLTGTIPTSALPPLAINDTFSVASQAAMTALTAQKGDMAIRTDTGAVFVLAADDATQVGNWKQISTPAAVVSVAGKTGTVALVKGDVGLDQVDNTSDTNKPISTATQAALDKKAVIGTTSGTAADAALVGDTTTDFVAAYNSAKS